MKAQRGSPRVKRLLRPNGSLSQTGNEASRSRTWRLFTRQQWEPCSWIGFKFLPKMVVIRMGLWVDLFRLGPVQLPESQIKPAAVYLWSHRFIEKTDGPEGTYRWIKKGGGRYIWPVALWKTHYS